MEREKRARGRVQEARPCARRAVAGRRKVRKSNLDDDGQGDLTGRGDVTGQGV